MSEEEIRAYLENKFAEVLATKNKGQIMKAVMGDLRGKADGKLINKVVASIAGKKSDKNTECVYGSS